MPLIHDSKETIRAHAQKDPKFRQTLLREATESYLNGDIDTGNAVTPCRRQVSDRFS